MKPEVRRHLRALVEALLADRPDARVVRPVLLAMIATAVRDFERYNDVRHAANRIADHDLMVAWEKARKDKAAPRVDGQPVASIPVPQRATEP